MGFFAAIMASLWALLAALQSGPDVVKQSGLSVVSVVATYVAAGVSAGALIGFLARYADNIAGRVVVATAGMFVVMFFVANLREGVFWEWELGNWRLIAQISVPMGVAFGLSWKTIARE